VEEEVLGVGEVYLGRKVSKGSKKAGGGGFVE